MRANLERARVLVVDDEEAVRRTYRRALGAYDLLEAVDGAAAIDILSRTEVDVVVCDLGMPRLGGLELMGWAKEHCPHPLWIVVSGLGSFDTAVHALKLGAFDFIAKPMHSLVHLETVVANAVQRQALVAERAALVDRLEANNVRLAESVKELESAYRAVRDEQARVEEDLRRAERIVSALLPRALPSAHGVQINVAYRPSQVIGGDLYGATMLDDRHLALYVADAAGHGVAAALLAVLFKQRLTLTDPRGRPLPPRNILAELNVGLIDECRASGLFVTAVVAIIDTVLRTVTIASAGHPPALWVRRDGSVNHVERGGPALGLELAASFTETRLVFDPGDRLLFYTDGLSAALAEPARDLEGVVRAAFAEATGGASTVDALITRARAGAEDDVTVLLVGAAAGDSTLATVHAPPSAPPPPSASETSIQVGAEGTTTWIAIRGRATWPEAPALADACNEALDSGRDVVVDLGDCASMDSTTLGTLHQVVDRVAPRAIVLQRVPEALRLSFVELSMTGVLSRITERVRTLPARMVTRRTTGNVAALGLVRRAHEALAKLSTHNAEEFEPVIAALAREAQAPA